MRAPPPQRLFIAFLATMAALVLCAWLLMLTHHPWLLPSFGGSCVILFGMPRGAMAQPRSLIGGHILSTIIGLMFHEAMHAFGGPIEFWGAAAVSTALALMLVTRTVHSPAGANPLVVFAEDAGWGFLVSPLLPGLAVLVVAAAIGNNLPRPWGAGSWPRRRTAATAVALGRGGVRTSAAGGGPSR